MVYRQYGNKSETIAALTLTTEELLASCPADRSLRIEVKREGSRITMVVNRLAPLEHDDATPLVPKANAKVEFFWPVGFQLQSLTAYERALPLVASDLERADEAFNGGHYEEAVRFYNQVSRETARDDTRQECQYKWGLCLQAQGDQIAANEKFKFVAQQSVAAESAASARWTILANAQLLRLNLREKTPEGLEQVHAILERLNHLRGEDRQLIPRLIIARDRDSIIYEAGGVGLSLLTRAPERLLTDVERVQRVVDLIDANPRHQTYAKLLQIRANRLAGRTREAQLLAAAWVKDRGHCLPEADFGKTILSEHAWLTIEQKGTAEQLTSVLRDIEAYLYTQGTSIRFEARRSARDLLIERARVLIALDRREEGEANLQRYLNECDQRTSGECFPLYASYSEACLLLGYLKEQAGDAERAQAIWKKAIWRSTSRDFFGLEAFPTNGLPLVNHLILSALTSDNGDLDPQQLLIGLMAGSGGTGDATGGNNVLRQLLQLVDLDAKFMQRAFGTPSARDWGRRMSFRDLSFVDQMRGPVRFCAAEYLRGSAIGGKLSTEDEAVVWNFVDSSIDHYHAQQLTETQLMLCATVWKGTNVPGIFGWAQAEPALPVQLRPQFAYLFGHRYQKLKRSSEAKTFFEYTVKHAPPDSELQTQAQAALEAISAAGR